MVYDEKVSSSENFQRQRLRWMSGQVQTLFLMLPYLPKAILRGNVNYVDKTIQQALIPRSLLLLFTPPLAIIVTAFSILNSQFSPLVVPFRRSMPRHLPRYSLPASSMRPASCPASAPHGLADGQKPASHSTE